MLSLYKYKRLQFIHYVNDEDKKTAKIITNAPVIGTGVSPHADGGGTLT